MACLLCPLFLGCPLLICFKLPSSENNLGAIILISSIYDFFSRRIAFSLSSFVKTGKSNRVVSSKILSISIFSAFHKPPPSANSLNSSKYNNIFSGNQKIHFYIISICIYNCIIYKLHLQP